MNLPELLLSSHGEGAGGEVADNLFRPRSLGIRDLIITPISDHIHENKMASHIFGTIIFY